MVERWQLGAVTTRGTTLERLVNGTYLPVADLDPLAAHEIVDILNAVPVQHLQKQVSMLCDDVQEILRRVTALTREVAR
jgi:predicted ATP-grasp superfamily ATP-dependent carboligase